jgi:hypothetical protein
MTVGEKEMPSRQIMPTDEAIDWLVYEFYNFSKSRIGVRTLRPAKCMLQSAFARVNLQTEVCIPCNL